MIDHGGEATIFKVSKGDLSFAAKKRMNPANRGLSYPEKMREYTNYIKEIENMNHNNNDNIIEFEEAYRDKQGNLIIVMELCDGNLKHKRQDDLGEGRYYDENIVLGIIKQLCKGV